VLSGKHLRLTSSIIGIHSVDNQRTAILIPEEAIVKVVSGPSADEGMMDVLWNDRQVAVFAVDIMDRAEETSTVMDVGSVSA